MPEAGPGSIDIWRHGPIADEGPLFQGRSRDTLLHEPDRTVAHGEVCPARVEAANAAPVTQPATTWWVGAADHPAGGPGGVERPVVDSHTGSGALRVQAGLHPAAIAPYRAPPIAARFDCRLTEHEGVARPVRDLGYFE